MVATWHHKESTGLGAKTPIFWSLLCHQLANSGHITFFIFFDYGTLIFKIGLNDVSQFLSSSNGILVLHKVS